MEVFQEYASYYNAFYQGKNYEEEAEKVDRILQYYGKNIGKIMNFGCGTGKHDIELAKKNYRCEGIDISPQMIDLAKLNIKEEALDIKVKVSDIQSFVPDGKYDAVISLFHVMSYQNTNSEIMSAFASARRCLDNGGLFLFDAWYGPGVLSDKPQVRVKEVEDDKKKLMRIARPVMNDKTDIVHVYYDILAINKGTNELHKVSEIHNMRYFFRPELELMLQESGFELIDNLDCNTLEQTDFTSWTSYFVSRAI